MSFKRILGASLHQLQLGNETFEEDDWHVVCNIVKCAAMSLPLSERSQKYATRLSDIVSSYFSGTSTLLDIPDVLKPYYRNPKSIESTLLETLANHITINASMNHDCNVYVNQSISTKIHNDWHKIPVHNNQSFASLFIHLALCCSYKPLLCKCNASAQTNFENETFPMDISNDSNRGNISNTVQYNQFNTIRQVSKYKIQLMQAKKQIINLNKEINKFKKSEKQDKILQLEKQIQRLSERSERDAENQLQLQILNNQLYEKQNEIQVLEERLQFQLVEQNQLEMIELEPSPELANNVIERLIQGLIILFSLLPRTYSVTSFLSRMQDPHVYAIFSFTTFLLNDLLTLINQVNSDLIQSAYSDYKIEVDVFSSMVKTAISLLDQNFHESDNKHTIASHLDDIMQIIRQSLINKEKLIELISHLKLQIKNLKSDNEELNCSYKRLKAGLLLILNMLKSSYSIFDMDFEQFEKKKISEEILEDCVEERKIIDNLKLIIVDLESDYNKQLLKSESCEKIIIQLNEKINDLDQNLIECTEDIDCKAKKIIKLTELNNQYQNNISILRDTEKNLLDEISDLKKLLDECEQLLLSSNLHEANKSKVEKERDLATIEELQNDRKELESKILLILKQLHHCQRKMILLEARKNDDVSTVQPGKRVKDDADAEDIEHEILEEKVVPKIVETLTHEDIDILLTINTNVFERITEQVEREQYLNKALFAIEKLITLFFVNMKSIPAALWEPPSSLENYLVDIRNLVLRDKSDDVNDKIGSYQRAVNQLTCLRAKVETKLVIITRGKINFKKSKSSSE